jgi:hypothetical protein
MADLVFNELSPLPQLGDTVAARQSMERFIDTIRASRDEGVATTLRIPANFFTISIANGYSVSDWQHDHAVPKEKRLFLGLLATKSPYLDNLIDNIATDTFDRSDFMFEGVRALGLGVAYLIDGICISVTNTAPWDKSSIDIRFQTIEESALEIVEQTVKVRHVSEPGHVGIHAAEARIDRLNAVDSGNSLWAISIEMFDRLQFCVEVEHQVKSLTPGAGGLPLVLRAFRELQELCNSWKDGTFDSRTIPNTTREGEATLQQYGEERTFTKSDGTRALFSWHIKRGSWRIYFIPSANDRTCLIGYIGPHLRTVRNKG